MRSNLDCFARNTVGGVGCFFGLFGEVFSFQAIFSILEVAKILQFVNKVCGNWKEFLALSRSSLKWFSAL